MKKIRVVITDNHHIYREAAAAALECSSAIEVIAFCENGQEAIEMARLLKPDLVMMDIHMKIMDGILATEIIRIEFPAIRVIGFSIESSPVVVNKMLKAGANGYLTKSSSREELLLAIDEVLNGRIYLCREIRHNRH